MKPEVKTIKDVEKKIKWLKLDLLQEKLYREGVSDGIGIAREIVNKAGFKNK